MLCRWTGQLTFPVTGYYSFAAVADDGMRLTIGGRCWRMLVVVFMARQPSRGHCVLGIICTSIEAPSVHSAMLFAGNVALETTGFSGGAINYAFGTRFLTAGRSASSVLRPTGSHCLLVEQVTQPTVVCHIHCVLQQFNRARA
jgi:hypothetical protein